jgi:hypothetical protein
MLYAELAVKIELICQVRPSFQELYVYKVNEVHQERGTACLTSDTTDTEGRSETGRPRFVRVGLLQATLYVKLKSNIGIFSKDSPLC